MSIRIVLVDDERLIRGGLRLMLSAEPDLEIVGEAEDGLAAVEVVRRVRPDLVLMDLRMPRLDGIAATAQILRTVQPPPAVLVLTTFHADTEVGDALSAGAMGYLLKDAPEARILHAIRTAAAGAMVLDAKVSRRLTEQLPGTGSPAIASTVLDVLTPRELQVLGLLAQGMTNQAIARAMHLGEATVKTHVGRVLAKLHLESRAEAVVLAYEIGVVRPKPLRRGQPPRLRAPGEP